MDGILVLISIAHSWLLLYCNTIDFYMLILYSTSLLYLFSNRFFYEVLMIFLSIKHHVICKCWQLDFLFSSGHALLLSVVNTSSIVLDIEMKVDIWGLFKIFENEIWPFPFGIMIAVGLLFMFLSAYRLISIVWMLSHPPNLPNSYYMYRVGYL